VFFGIQDDGKSPEKFCEFCTTYTIVRILSSLPEFYRIRMDFIIWTKAETSGRL
jgi:hypothetical protein